MEDPILTYLGRERIIDNQWVPPGVMTTYAATRQRVITKTVTFNTNTETHQLFPCNMDTPVSVWNIKVHGGSNSTNYDIIWGCNYIPRVLAHRQEELDRISEAFGMVKGGVDIIRTGYNGQFPKPVFPLRSVENVAPLNPEWIQCVTLLNPNNITNGLVAIPREICLQHPLISQFVWKGTGAEEQAPSGAISQWYAIPPKHILAYNLNTMCNWNLQTTTPGTLHPVPMRVGTSTEPCCYLVCDKEIEQLYHQLLNSWLPLVERIPLHNIGFSVHPKPNTPPPYQPGIVTLQVSIGYIECLDNINVDSLYPALKF
jgi:hypothetical protein